MRWAAPFDPEVVWLYNGGTAIGYAEAVQWNATTAVEFSDPQPAGEQRMRHLTPGTAQPARTTGVTTRVPTIKQATTIATNNSFCGVAMDAISANSWGRVALWGLVDIKLGPAANITVDDILIVSAAGCFAEHPGIATAVEVHAFACEAMVTTVTAYAFVQAFIPPDKGVGNCMGGASTV